MNLSRGSGILLHPTSLPGKWGIGDLGPAAYQFVDFLKSAGQSWWQMLPLGPTGYGNSPYMCFSAIAGNPLLISPEKLMEDGFVLETDPQGSRSFPVEHVDYPRVITQKHSIFRKAYEQFKIKSSAEQRQGFLQFREKQASWLEDFSLFMALKETHEGRSWTRWDRPLIVRDSQALQDCSRRFRDTIDYHQFLQYVFFNQWFALKQYAHAHGVRIIGDLPIYIAHDSSDVWAHPDLFYLDDQGHPSVVAGVPPDYFSTTGQRWGNPIYRWDARARSGYQWWIDRFRANLVLADVIRLDHFRGFEAYWEIPESEPYAINGRWVKGPGAELFAAVKAALGDLPVIAEDLGVITPEVETLRDTFGFPGMRILQMAFGRDPKAHSYRPHYYIQNCIVYTATHDHNTTVGWFTAEPGKETTQCKEEVEEERSGVVKFLGTDGREIHWDMIRLAMSSVAHLAIIPLQDVFGLGSDCRMNRPGTLKGNWEWRFHSGHLTEQVRTRLWELTDLFDRLPISTQHEM
ncbi:MAG: 4-alpha-glucanotransferase [Nitrospirales bacterium]